MQIKKTIFTVIASLLWMTIIIASANAQSDESKFEVGVQFAALRQGNSYWFNEGSGLGGGGRLTFNLTKNIALEGEMNYFPGEGYYNVRRLQGQFGVKSGVRFNQFGIFGKIRPGFMNTKYDYEVVCVTFPCPPLNVDRTGFSLDIGGVVEFYPARRLTVRFDVGDTIFARSDVFYGILASEKFDQSLFLPPKRTTHNLQINAGIGFRF